MKSFSISRCLYFWFNMFSYSNTFFCNFSEKNTDSYLFHFTRTLNCLFSLWKSLNLHLTISDFLNQVSRGISIISSSRSLISSDFEYFLIATCRSSKSSFDIGSRFTGSCLNIGICSRLNFKRIQRILQNLKKFLIAQITLYSAVLLGIFHLEFFVVL